MLAHDAYGGLEHRASSVNLYHPHFAASRKAYEGLLELCGVKEVDAMFREKSWAGDARTMMVLRWRPTGEPVS